MSAGPCDFDRWVLACLARKHGGGVWLCCGAVLTAFAFVGRWLIG